MSRSHARIALIVLDLFVAVTAIGGGLALVAGLEGARFPIEWLSGTPFGDYTVPGLILVVVVGGTAAFAAAALLLHARFGGAASIVAGLAMLGWIAGEILHLTADGDLVSSMEVLYLAVGGSMIVLGLTVRPARKRGPTIALA